MDKFFTLADAVVSFSSRPGVKSPVEEQAAASELELEMVPRGDQILSGR
jgi:hypothetical protein